MFISCVFSYSAYAATITTLFNTGVDESGVGLGGLVPGAADPHYYVVGDGVAEVVSTINPYVANSTTSQWIWQNDDGSPTYTTLTFRTSFSLDGFDPSSAVIVGKWGTDNQGMYILINSHSTGIQLLGVVYENFTSLHAFSLPSSFYVAGVNTLEFVIKDDGVIGAFRVELTGTANEVPEPTTMLLLAFGLMGLVGVRRKM